MVKKETMKARNEVDALLKRVERDLEAQWKLAENETAEVGTNQHEMRAGRETAVEAVQKELVVEQGENSRVNNGVGSGLPTQSCTGCGSGRVNDERRRSRARRKGCD